MASIVAELLAGSLFPRVESPWPESIGLSFPFALSGASAALAGVIKAHEAKEQRDRAIGRAGVCGFLLGAAFYLASLAIQLGSSL